MASPGAWIKSARGYYQQQLERLHLGLENRLGQKVGSLSGGQRQALALLLATMTPIDILVLDEHTAALDPKSSENVMRLTDELVREKGLTTIMVTHNLKYAVEYGSRLIMMHAAPSWKTAAARKSRGSRLRICWAYSTPSAWSAGTKVKGHG